MIQICTYLCIFQIFIFVHNSANKNLNVTHFRNSDSCDLTKPHRPDTTHILSSLQSNRHETSMTSSHATTNRSHDMHLNTTHQSRMSWTTTQSTLSMLSTHPLGIIPLCLHRTFPAPNRIHFSHRVRPRDDRKSTTDERLPSSQWTAWSISA